MPVRHHLDRPTRISPASGGRDRRKTRRALALLFISATAAVALFGCSTQYKPEDFSADQSVNILLGATTRGVHAFSPSPTYVLVGTKITWTNEDSVAHRLAGVSGNFECPDPLQPGERYSAIFTQQGYFQYRCMVPGHRESGVIYVLP